MKATGSSRKLFWITQKWPLPADDGARRATFHLLKGLTAQGVDIELCAIIPESESHDSTKLVKSLGVRTVHVIKRKPARHLLNLLTHPFVPLTIAQFAAADVTRQIQTALGDRSSETVVVFDGLHAASSLQGKLKQPTVYRAHNVESSLWVQGARTKRNPFAALFLRFQALLMRRFEKQVCEDMALVATVSDLDTKNFHATYGSNFKTTSVPIGIGLDTSKERLHFPRSRNILFIGRLDWPPNRDGLRWFLENVWPDVIKTAPDVTLAIAGAGDGEWLKPFLGMANIKFLGRVAEVAPAYRDAIASLVPVFFGSGTRVKAIEASSFGRPCISTAVGIEGIGLDPDKNYYNVETKEQWLKVLQNLSVADAKARGNSAYELIVDKFDPLRIAARFLVDLEKALGN
ncbi:MAG: glycosyltransferase [Deltaproteobacteria bacterium]|nr:glycosyltransferase [Deltaproteobacteria bacterium]